MALYLRLLLLAAVGAAAAVPAPRGFNTWDNLPNIASEADVLAAAKYVAENLIQFGYDTIVIDGGWYNVDRADAQFSLDAFGRPYPNTSLFPSALGGGGLGPLADKIHSMGLKLGAWDIRGIASQAVAANLPIFGSPFHARDAIRYDTNCSWDRPMMGTNAPSAAADAWYKALALWWVEQRLDFIKMDCMWTGGGGLYDGDVAAFASAFVQWAPGVTISWSPGDNLSFKNGSYIASHGRAWGSMYRVTADFHDNSWAPVAKHLDIAVTFTPLIGVNDTYPDLDMLPLGRQARSGGPPTPCLFTHDEQRLIMTLWAVMRAPLMIGALLPLDADDAWTLSLLTNPRVLRVNNHTTATATAPVMGGGAGLYAWTARAVADNALVVALFNAQDAPARVAIALPPSAALCATDLWSGAPVDGRFSATFGALIPSHSAGLYELAACR